MTRILDEVFAIYVALADGPDWGTWICHAVVGLAFGYARQPWCAVAFYGLREAEQVLWRDDLSEKWLDHLMDLACPALAAFAASLWL